MPDERTIVADIKSWIDELSSKGFRAEVEEHIEEKRSDLRVFHRDRILFNGEFKKPSTIEGRNAKAASLVRDAFVKASEMQPVPARFFVTSNLNETVVWDNADQSRPLMSRDVTAFKLTPEIRNDADFERQEQRNALKSIMQQLVESVFSLSKRRSGRYKPLGESFIDGLNSHLNAAVFAAKRHIPDDRLRKWWREQGYLLPTDGITDEHRERMARYSLYVLANRVVFYYVLKRTFTALPGIHVSEEISGISELERIITRAFDDAQEYSGDFETVYEKGIADFIPFNSDDMLYPLVSLLRFLEAYDFSTLSQEILGNLYDRLISPEERHNYGQYYTPIPVVDLINALTIKDKEARVLDPACGSGTFLTRAFELKLMLRREDNKEVREKLIEELFGVDIADYPTHLATVALSSKLLFADPEVYPRIVHKDFLDVKSENIVPRFRFGPKSEKTDTRKLSGEGVAVEFRPIDAVVGNLPYIRQEDISNKEKEQKKIELWLKQSGFPSENDEDLPDNKADFHVYFWHYILPFLKEGSRVGFLTSDTWLNVEYGQNLKKFINKYFKIVAVIDSSVERWFEDALVNTVITVLERTSDERARRNNKIKFVRINRKIAELIPDLKSARRIAKDIENGEDNERVTIVREVRQGDIDLDDVLKSKFFPYLRAPDEFFQLVSSDKMVPLGEVMDIRFGIKTGANEFFYVEDVTDDYSPDELQTDHGLRQGETSRLRVIRDGTGQEHIIEKEYLRPILKSPKEFTKTGTLVFNGPTKKFVVLIEATERNKIKSHALKYIEYGEEKGYPRRPAIESRNPWWKLSPIIYPDIVLTMDFSSKYLFPRTNFLLDHRMYFGKSVKSNMTELICASLNSTLFFMHPDMLGRNHGGGGAPVEFMVFELKKVPVIDPDKLAPFRKEIIAALDSMEHRPIGSVFEEIWNVEGQFEMSVVKEDRKRLDVILLKALGIEDTGTFLSNWYQLVTGLVKERIEKAVSLRTTSNSNRNVIEKIANEIVGEIEFKTFPEDYVALSNNEKRTVFDTSQVNDPLKDITWGRDLNGYFVSIKERKTYFESRAEAEYAYYCTVQKKEEIRIPGDCESVVAAFDRDVTQWIEKIRELVDEQTDDENHRTKLLSLCLSRNVLLTAREKTLKSSGKVKRRR